VSRRQVMVWLAWGQLALSLVCIPFFVAPIAAGTKLVLLGVMSALTWTGTALGHLAASWAARDLEETS
jgi:ABC-type sulfate transport system permease subunit